MQGALLLAAPCSAPCSLPWRLLNTENTSGAATIGVIVAVLHPPPCWTASSYVLFLNLLWDLGCSSMGVFISSLGYESSTNTMSGYLPNTALECLRLRFSNCAMFSLRLQDPADRLYVLRPEYPGIYLTRGDFAERILADLGSFVMRY